MRLRAPVVEFADPARVPADGDHQLRLDMARMLIEGNHRDTARERPRANLSPRPRYVERVPEQRDRFGFLCAHRREESYFSQRR